MRQINCQNGAFNSRSTSVLSHVYPSQEIFYLLNTEMFSMRTIDWRKQKAIFMNFFFDESEGTN